MKRLLAVALLALLAPAICFGALLGDPISHPLISYDSAGTLQFSAGTGALSVGARPVAMQLTSGGTPISFGGAGSLAIGISLGASGMVVGGTPTDFVLQGDIDLGGMGMFSGTLLEGTVTAFGFSDAGVTDNYDFRVTVTGGTMASIYGGAGSVLTVTTTSENSSFTGSFTADFSGGAKGTIGGGPTPPACKILVDKTCCIPPPPTSSTAVCSGGLTRLQLEFTGDDCSSTSNAQGGKAKCTGNVGALPADVVSTGKDANKYFPMPSKVFASGDIFEMLPSPGESKLKNDLRFAVGGQDLTIHVSCSQPINLGDQFGSVRVVEYESVNGGLVTAAPPPNPNTNTTACVSPNTPPGTLVCSGIKDDPNKAPIVEVVFKYTGADCEAPLGNDQAGKATCAGDPSGVVNVTVANVGKNPGTITVSPASNVNVGDLVRLTATGADKLEADTKLNVIDPNTAQVIQALTIHTSCSKPLSLGDVFGALTVVEVTDVNGKVSKMGDPDAPIFFDQCKLPSAPMGPHCVGKVTGMTLTYLGGNCTISNLQSGKATCSGGVLGAPASITSFASSAQSSTPSSFNIGDLVRIDTSDSVFPAQTTFTVGDGSATQNLSIHTSCSQPLNLGDRFGAFEVFSLDLDDGSTIALGGTVEYQYTVTNPNADPAEVTVEDDQLGVIAMDEILDPGETRTFFKKATLTDTTKNTATVTAHVACEMCEAMDMVTVDLVEPPAPPFTCTTPVSGFTMIWNGGIPVDVVAYQRAVGTTIVGTFNNVMPGDEVTVTGLAGVSGNDTYWKVYQAGTMTPVKSGISTFHISCSDSDMNGVEDCGKNEGDGKQKSGAVGDPTLVNDWLLEGMVGALSKLDCTVP